jgi:hypothetical protein
MRYIVTVEVQDVYRQQFFVEASTENDASLTAMHIAQRHSPNMVHGDVISVEEEKNSDKNDMTARNGGGYLKRIL